MDNKLQFGGLRDRQRDYIDWVLRESLSEGIEINDVITDEAATVLAARLKTPLQTGRHLVRAFEAGFEMGVKPIDAVTVEAVLSRRIDFSTGDSCRRSDRFTKSGWRAKRPCTRFCVNAFSQK